MMPSQGKPGLAAIVEFASIDEAKWVVENLNGNMPQGLTDPVACNFKRERAKGKGKNWGKDDGGYGKSGWSPKGSKGWGKDDGGYGKSVWSPKGGKGKHYSPWEG